MNLIQSLSIALSMLAANKARSALTMLGIIIGVMGVTVTVEMVEGFRSFMSEQFKSLGSEVLMVFYDPGRRGRGEGRGPISALTTKDIENIWHCQCDRCRAYRYGDVGYCQWYRRRYNSLNRQHQHLYWQPRCRHGYLDM